MERLEVTLLGRSYTLACAPDEKDALLQAVALFEERAQAIRQSGKVIGTEKIAVMAALQIAGEMLKLRQPDGPLGSESVADFKRRIGDMNRVLDDALEPQERLF